MSIGAITPVGAVFPQPVLPQLLRVESVAQVEALTRLAITPSVTADQLATALGMNVEELIGAVRAYQSALRSLLSTAGFWIPAVDGDVAAALPLVDPRNSATGSVRTLPVDASAGAVSGNPVGVHPPEHDVYVRIADLRTGVLLDVASGGDRLPLVARMAVQVGSGPTGLVFLLDQALPAGPESVHAAAQQAIVAAGRGAAPATVVAGFLPAANLPDLAGAAAGTSGAVSSGAVSPAAVLAPTGSIPGTQPTAEAASANAAQVATAQGASTPGAAVPAASAPAPSADGTSASGAVGAQAGAPTGAGSQALTGDALRAALLAARDDPRAGYRAWPSGPLLTEPVPLRDIPDVVRQAQPAAQPLVLPAPSRESGNVQGLLQVVGTIAPADPAQTAASTAVTGARGADAAIVVPKGVQGEAVIVADGRAVPAAIEAAVQQRERVAALVLDLSVLLRNAIKMAGVGAAATAGAIAGAPQVANPARFAELLAATTLAPGQKAPPRRRKVRPSGGERTAGLAEDFFAALFAIRVAEDVRALEVPTTIIGPDLAEAAALLKAVEADHLALSIRLSDLPSVEILEVLRLD